MPKKINHTQNSIYVVRQFAYIHGVAGISLFSKKKQSHAQDNIYVVRQFAYVHGVVGISLLSRKNTEYNLRLQYFLSI